ncbi:hypothetical protein M1M07_24010 [Rhodococcus sp. HM1]|uniref:hypothetical protein n=1 Tax=unclassified Rhodococcus (in: high G+C Gram-positive bacteria) TaxID=192944 RepID=UPI0018CF1B95|nr:MULTISPECIES: hypothetical protein [unclassified Rhodococcus (in: high G+C Gram-positive bacteria)]MBH0118545.1 hypothetical protein [Rhodococcus sp. CX]MCK8674164.1 hypothetical protein [Rhodococcus sp. HM1]
MTGPVPDIRDLLGMRTPAAWALVALYAVTCVLLAVDAAPDAGAIWPLIPAAGVCIAAAVALVAVPGDPMPLGPSIALASSGVVSCGFVLLAGPLPMPDLSPLWTVGLSKIIFSFMCVRGRVALAWLGYVLMFATAIVGAGEAGEVGFVVVAINAAPVLMGTVFAYMIRPVVRSIYELREQSTQRIAAEAAASAMIEERDAQLDRLDELARPLLERIASGSELDDAERLECLVLEARLRDTVRAPMLQNPALVEEVAAARRRGVDVVLLDDHGMDDAEPAVRDRVQGAIADELAAVTDGSVTVRVLPPGRATMVSVLVSGESVRRAEFGPDGNRRDRTVGSSA